METLIEKYKGIHPGIVLNRLLDKKHISQRPFALMTGEYPQTINAITKGRRKLNTALISSFTGMGFEFYPLDNIDAEYAIQDEKGVKFVTQKFVDLIEKHQLVMEFRAKN